MCLKNEGEGLGTFSAFWNIRKGPNVCLLISVGFFARICIHIFNTKQILEMAGMPSASTFAWKFFENLRKLGNFPVLFFCFFFN